MPQRISETMTKLTRRAEGERALLESGQKPPPRLKSAVQRIAARALAGFFALMLVFTLVSRAADSFAVARVTADTVKSGVLTERVALGGTLEPLGDLELTLPGGIRVMAVSAAQGQQVSKGDVLLELDGGDIDEQLQTLGEKLSIVNMRLDMAQSHISSADASGVLAAQTALNQAEEDYERLLEKLGRSDARAGEDLQAAQDALAEAHAAYDKAIEKARADYIRAAEDKLKSANSNLKTVKESAADAISAAQYTYDSALERDNNVQTTAWDKVSDAQAALNDAQAELSALESAGGSDAAAIAAAQAEVDAAQNELGNALSNAANASGETLETRRAREVLATTTSKWNDKIAEAEEDVREAERELNEARQKTDMSDQQTVISAQSTVDSAQRSMTSAQRSMEDTGYSAEEQLKNAQRAIQTAQRNLDQARQQADNSAISDEKSRKQAEIEKLSYLSEKRELEKSIAELSEIAEMDGKLVSPIDGTVLSITERGRTQEGAQAAVISRRELGFSFEAKTAQEAAEKLAVGDTGTISYTAEGKSQSVNAAITSISAADSDGMVVVTAALPDGTYSAGASAELVVSRRSEKQNACLPLSALRSDSDGDYVLVMREKNSVTGTVQTAERVPVTVLGRDSELMSISSTLLREDKIITGSSRPVYDGDRVRPDE